jgi:hypothetical protein
MAKRRVKVAREGRLAELVQKYVEQLVEAVQEEVRISVASEVQHLLTGERPRGLAKLLRVRRKRVLPCIAPNCQNPSKGPRFHYLCVKHKDAPKKDYEAWRKARQEKARAEAA